MATVTRTYPLTVWTDPSSGALQTFFESVRLQLNTTWEAGARITGMEIAEQKGTAWMLVVQWDLTAAMPAVNAQGVVIYGEPMLNNGVGLSVNLATGVAGNIPDDYIAFMSVVQVDHLAGRVLHLAQVA